MIKLTRMLNNEDSCKPELVLFTQEIVEIHDVGYAARLLTLKSTGEHFQVSFQRNTLLTIFFRFYLSNESSLK